MLTNNDISQTTAQLAR